MFTANSVFLLLKQEQYNKLLPYWKEKLIDEHILEEKNSAVKEQELRKLIELENAKKYICKKRDI